MVYMRRSSIYTSAAFHAIILLIAIMGLPFLHHREFVIPPPITVDLVEISKVTQTTQEAPKPAPPKPPEPPKPAPAPVNTAPQPVAPVKEPPKPEEKKEPPKPVRPQIDENALPDKAAPKKPPKREEKKPPAPQRDFASVLKNLDVSKQPPAPPKPAQQAPIGEKMTISEEDALRVQLEGCWNVPIGAKDIENMAVDIVMTINPDRTLREAHVADQSRYNSDPVFQSVADSALRAVRSSSCSPFAVPPDKYDIWNTTTVTFSAKDMM